MTRRTLRVLTNSELNTWRTCHQRWGLQYHERLRPLARSAPMDWGNLYHAGCEAGWYGSQTVEPSERLARAQADATAEIARRVSSELERTDLAAREGAFDGDYEQSADEIEQAAREATWAVCHYFQCAADDLRHRLLGAEIAFSVKIPVREKITVPFAGKIDLVLYDEDQNMVLVQDHKSTGFGVDTLARKLPLDTQMTGYLAAVRRFMLGRWPDVPGNARTGVIGFNISRRAMPSTPKLNLLKKSECKYPPHSDALAQQTFDGEPRGLVSVAAIDTLGQMYADALDDQAARGFAVTEKQLERLAELVRRGDTFFVQHSFVRDDAEIARWAQELHVESLQIKAAHRNQRMWTRNPGACTGATSYGCAYSAVCAEDSPATRQGFRVAETEHEELA